MAEKTIKLFLATASEISARGLQSIFSEDPSVEIVGLCHQAVRIVEEIAQTGPDVVILDVDVPLAELKDIICNIQERVAVRLLLITADPRLGGNTILDFTRLGVYAHCSKSCESADLKMALQAAYRRDVWISSEIVLQLSSATMVEDTARHRNKLIATLSDREREVLNLMMKGLTNRQIAEALTVSSETIKTHVRHIMEKFAAHDRSNVVLKALQADCDQQSVSLEK